MNSIKSFLFFSIVYLISSCNGDRFCPGYKNDNSEWFTKVNQIQFEREDSSDVLTFNLKNSTVDDSSKAYSFSKSDCSAQCPQCGAQYVIRYNNASDNLTYLIVFRINGKGNEKKDKTVTISFDITNGAGSCCQTQIFPSIEVLASNGTYLGDYTVNGNVYHDVIYISDASAITPDSKCDDLYYSKKIGIIRFKYRVNNKFYSLI